MNLKNDTWNEKVWFLCSQIPKGKVSTYKRIANALGGNACRAVGNALRANPYAPNVPCHRVVCSDGSLGGFSGKMHNSKKIELLAKEGIVVKNWKIVDFEKKNHIF